MSAKRLYAAMKAGLTISGEVATDRERFYLVPYSSLGF